MPPSLSRILDARGAQRVALSPDGGTLYFVTDLTGTMQLWGLRLGGGLPVRLSYECDRVGAYRPSPDGTRIAYGADEGGNERWAIWVLDADGSCARRITSRPDRIHHLVDWSRDGRSLIVFAKARRILLTGRPRGRLRGGLGRAVPGGSAPAGRGSGARR